MAVKRNAEFMKMSLEKAIAVSGHRRKNPGNIDWLKYRLRQTVNGVPLDTGTILLRNPKLQKLC